ncbi:MAG: DUF1838 family protein [Gammaproteobacteria bacterium]|nr:DUF1838 family protein [Gammaproteobacteria bacterium]
MAASLLAATTGFPVRSPAAELLDLKRDADLLRAYQKMRFSMGPELNIGWLRAKRFAVSQGRVEPLCGLVAATFSRVNRVTDDLFEVIVLEITHYTDFDSGALLQTLTMPFTNQLIEVPAYRFGPAKSRFSVRLNETESFAPAANTNEGEFAAAGQVAMTKSLELSRIHAGDAFLRHEEYGRVYPANTELPSMFYKESTTWSAPLREVADSEQRQVDATVSYAAMTSWRPWMKMGDTPGHTSSNGFGRRARSVEDLPDDFLAYTRETAPDVLDDPLAALTEPEI